MNAQMTYSEIVAENSRLRDGLNMIAARADKIARPNGTTKVLGRIAVAALIGEDIEQAAARNTSNRP